MNHWKKTFSIIWAGQFVSVLSSIVVGYAIVLWMTFETQSAEVLAMGTLASLLPHSLIGLFAGVYVDRFDRKKVMIFADLFIALCTLALAFIFWFGEPQLGYIYLLLMLRSVGSAFHEPAMQASIPLIAPENELGRVAGVNQVIFSIGNIAGPAISALMISLMNFGWVLMIDVAGAVVAIVTLCLVKIPNPEREKNEERQIFREMKEGMDVILKHPGIRWLFVFSVLTTLLIMPGSALYPLMTLQHFGGKQFEISIVEASWGIGMLLGGTLMGVWKHRLNKVIIINITAIVFGFTFFASGLLSSSAYLVFVLLTGIGGAAGSVYFSSFTSLIQTKVDPAKMGRVFSTFSSISLIPSMLGLMGTGFLADNVGLTFTFVLTGGLMMLIGALSFTVPRYLELGK